MALLLKHKMAYISKTVHLTAKRKALPLVKLYQIYPRNPENEKKMRKQIFPKVTVDGSAFKEQNGLYL